MNITNKCIQAIYEDLQNHGDAIRPLQAEQWDEIDANRTLGRITGNMDIYIPDLVNIIIQTINKGLEQ